MLYKIYGATCVGIDTIPVTIETDITPGIAYVVVGLPDNAVRESQHRIMSALHHFGYKIPGKRVVVNLAPADLKKAGTGFDLGISTGILTASGQIEPALDLSKYIIMGELALDGSLRHFNGALAIAADAAAHGFKGCIFPVECAMECIAVRDVAVYGLKNLDQVIAAIKADIPLDDFLVNAEAMAESGTGTMAQWDEYAGMLSRMIQKGVLFENDLAYIKGQNLAKQALEIAAAGNHNILFTGSPGCGKSMLASALPTILPPMTYSQAIETGKIYSISGMYGNLGKDLLKRPFRSPHSSITNQSLTGGGWDGMPGEMSLASNGVLFLDELAEFRRDTLELLRQPLEEKKILVSRVKQKFSYPANFILVAATNPCPCGYLYEDGNRCICSSSGIMRYRSRISGPLLDRMDLHLILKQFKDTCILSAEPCSESSAMVALRVLAAAKIQYRRFGRINCSNGAMTNSDILKYCSLDKDGNDLMQAVSTKGLLSPRAYTRCLKVARTVADLHGREQISVQDISTALQFRFSESNYGFCF